MMTPQILDGKKIASEVRQELKRDIAHLGGRAPALAFILIGHHAPSQSYVQMKKRACQEVGIISHIHALDENVPESALLQLLHKLNCDPHVDGILVQQPFPAHIDTLKVVEGTDPSKDVDGFHPLNLGKLLASDASGFVPCTPLGVQLMLKKSGIKTAGKHIVIVGRSQIVGKPLAALLLQKGPYADATVTIAHSKTSHLAELCATADILISAIGSPKFITPSMVKKGAIVIDVGINRNPEGKIVGDVDFDQVAPLTSAITPVPGGVGPLTIAMLLANTWKSYLWRENRLSSSSFFSS